MPWRYFGHGGWNGPMKERGWDQLKVEVWGQTSEMRKRRSNTDMYSLTVSVCIVLVVMRVPNELNCITSFTINHTYHHTHSTWTLKRASVMPDHMFITTLHYAGFLHVDEFIGRVPYPRCHLTYNHTCNPLRSLYGYSCPTLNLAWYFGTLLPWIEYRV